MHDGTVEAHADKKPIGANPYWSKPIGANPRQRRRQGCLGEVYIHRWHAYHNQYAINSTKRHRPGADCQRSGSLALKAVGDLRLGDGIGRGKKSAAEGASHASSYSAMEDKLEVPPRVNRGDRLISSQAEHSLQWLCTRRPARRAHPPLFR